MVIMVCFETHIANTLLQSDLRVETPLSRVFTVDLDEDKSSYSENVGEDYPVYAITKPHSLIDLKHTFIFPGLNLEWSSNSNQ